jgi:penicillin-binding protein 1B
MALVAVRVSDGAIVAMVGGADYQASAFNRAFDGRRQLGSTVKPLTWLFAFEDDPALSSSTPIPDQAIERQVGEDLWAPTNYDGEYKGVVSMGEALAQSRNVPAILVAERVGMKRLKSAWRSLGLSGATAFPSAALGAFDGTPVELAAAYTVFPGKGEAVRPRLVRSVRLPDGSEGWREGIERKRHTSERAAFLATDALVDVVETGTGRRVRSFGVRGVVGGKTGTTDNAHDAWFVGFTETLSVAVWVGFDKGKHLGLTGAQAAAPAWARFVSGSGTEGRGFASPDTVISVDLCMESGAIALVECPEQASAWFSVDTEPIEYCPFHGEIDEGEAARMRAIERVRERMGELGEEPPERQRRGWFRRRKAKAEAE